MTMTFRLTDASHDLTIVGGSLAKVTGAEEVRQRVLVALFHEWQEYFMNELSGVPWQEIILGSKDLRIIETILRWAILQVPGVVSILVLESTFAARQLQIYATIEVEGESGNETINISLLKGG